MDPTRKYLYCATADMWVTGLLCSAYVVTHAAVKVAQWAQPVVLTHLAPTQLQLSVLSGKDYLKQIWILRATISVEIFIRNPIVRTTYHQESI